MKDNGYAVLLIAMGAGIAVLAAYWGNKDLLGFGSTVAGYGAALFQRASGEKTS